MGSKKDIAKRLITLRLRQRGNLVIDLSRKYHVITSKDELLISTNSFEKAWQKIRGKAHGTRLVRNDGVLLAYSSTAQGGRIKKGFPRKVVFVGEMNEKDGASEETPSN